MPRPRPKVNKPAHSANGSNGHAKSQAAGDVDYALVQNAILMQRRFLDKVLDEHHDIDKECGYPREISPQDYRYLFDREGIAEKVVKVWPRESWKVDPEIYEQEEADETDFELAWIALENRLGMFSYLQRVDELSGIGHFGVMLLGLSDGKSLSEPVAGVEAALKKMREAKPKKAKVESEAEKDEKEEPDEPTENLVRTKKPPVRDLNEQDAAEPDLDEPDDSDAEEKPKGKSLELLFLRVFDESLVMITESDVNPQSPRYGQPVYYSIQMQDPAVPTAGGPSATTMTERVHWTRVLHVADNRMSSEVFGVPRMRPVFNRLVDLRRLYGGSAEMFWKGAFPGYVFEANPDQLDADMDPEEIKAQVYRYTSGLQRYFGMMGITVKGLSPQVSDPTAHINAELQAISIALDIPQRILMGSERGELSSSQDARSWNDRLIRRQNKYLSHCILRPFIDRMMAARVLPTVEEYQIDWPDLNTLTDMEKAELAGKITTALGAYVKDNIQELVPPMEYFTGVLGKQTDEAEAWIEAASKQIDDEETQTGKPLDPLGGQGVPPPGVPGQAGAMSVEGILGAEPDEEEPTENAFASGAQRRWYFANLAADKATGGGGGKKSAFGKGLKNGGPADKALSLVSPRVRRLLQDNGVEIVEDSSRDDVRGGGYLKYQGKIVLPAGQGLHGAVTEHVVTHEIGHAVDAALSSDKRIKDRTFDEHVYWSDENLKKELAADKKASTPKEPGPSWENKAKSWDYAFSKPAEAFSHIFAALHGDDTTANGFTLKEAMPRTYKKVHDKLKAEGLLEQDKIVQNVEVLLPNAQIAFNAQFGSAKASARQRATQVGTGAAGRAKAKRGAVAAKRKKNRERLKGAGDKYKRDKGQFAKKEGGEPGEIDPQQAQMDERATAAAAERMKAIRNELEEAGALLEQAKTDPKQGQALRAEARKIVVRAQRDMRAGGLSQTQVQQVLRKLVGSEGMAELAKGRPQGESAPVENQAFDVDDLDECLDYLILYAGMDPDVAEDLVFNGFASGASRRWFFANLAKQKEVGGKGGGATTIPHKGGARAATAPAKGGSDLSKDPDLDYTEVKVKYKDGADPKTLGQGFFGRPMTHDEVCALGCATAGSRVTVYRKDTGIGIVTQSDQHEAVRYLSKNVDGEVILRNDSIEVHKTGTGLGTKLFARQVEVAGEMRVKEIETYAIGTGNGVDGPRSKDAVGYAVWPRLGYNMKLTPLMKELITKDMEGPLKDAYAKAETFHDLYAIPGGIEAWKLRGFTSNMKFDPTPGSPHRKILSYYIDSKFGGKITFNKFASGAQQRWWFATHGGKSQSADKGGKAGLSGGSSKNSGGEFVSRAEAEKFAKESAITTPLFRSSSSPDQMPSEARGGHTALGDGVYFGESADAVKGYGSSVVEFRASVRDVKEVAGDAEMNQITSDAKAFGEAKVASHLADVAAKKTEVDPTFIAEHAAPSGQIRSYLESKGFDALRYKHKTKDDHHDQVVVFRAHNLVGIEDPTNNQRSFSSTQVDLTGAVRDAVLSLTTEIPDADLAEDGREEEPHVTLLFGLHAAEPDEVIAMLADEPPIRLRFGKTSIFSANEVQTQRGGAQYDVVKVDVESDDLERLHEKLAELPHTDTHPEYKPHVTLAYVKPGKGKLYAGNDALDGEEFVAESVVFSAVDGTLTKIKLGASDGKR